ncbi:lanthionine synthetase LanC family protein [Mycobacterium sp. 852002-51057_SCH5723018]|uniref:lanthionine synthetase LanC family protein n=1 Tax=Mycobacterium sp. 852002-51057_SCH5723018 TaxID=1834094 RepID=UPI0007FC7A9A|nr:lanthionine synthetase LanC family protein [Mycobacterium sp. 852002-51057_SCH5723018]OBG28737.1 hypothetical protein A5764_24335 [Mycobacterium sp. 852002-51057_SCH5723018]
MHPDFVEIAESTAATTHAGATHRMLGDLVAPRTARPAGSDDGESRLAAALYHHSYIRPPAGGAGADDLISERDFVAALTRANHTPRTWVPGWVITGTVDQRIAVSRNGVALFARAEEVRPAVAAGPNCEVLLPTERRGISAGFYQFVGESAPAGADDVARARLYWHLTAAAGPQFVAAVSRVLNSSEIPFQAKVIDRPGGYRRADAGVLYLAVTDLSRAQDAIADIYAELAAGLRESVPMWTRKLAPGLSIACDPGDGTSFGQAICTIIAHALAAHHRDRPRAAEICSNAMRLDAIGAVLTARQIDVQRPYLYRATGAVAEAICHFDPLAARLESRPPPPPVSMSGGDRDRAVIQGAAIDVGETLLQRAVFNPTGTLCNWVCRVPLVPGDPEFGHGVRAAAMGSALYDGLSGVAVFLSELSLATGDDRFGRAACAAMRCALRQLSFPAARRRPDGFGLYSGAAGVLFAAERLRRDIGFEDDDMVLDQFLRAVNAYNLENDHDLISGRAGLIMALLGLSADRRSPECERLATALGAELACYVDEAIGQTECPAADLGPISGISHGAAGMGLALAALHARSGDPCFLSAARAAFTYEYSLFDEAEQNWPDLRSAPAAPDVHSGRQFLITWCYGAPGLALALGATSRLDTVREAWYLNQARVALESTAASLPGPDSVSACDASLCHGVAGLIDVLLYGATELAMPEYRSVAMTAGARLARGWLDNRVLTYGASSGGPNYSLMLGLSGIGMAWLRLADPGVKSPLLPLP